jgi:hypothetical protein
MWENLRRFWTIPAFSFLLYLVFCIMPTLMAPQGIGMRNSYLESFLDHQNFLAMSQYCVFPAITAIVLFRYLHSTASATTLHAMPFSRMKLFSSNVVSGLAMLWAPVVLTGLLILAVRPDYPADLLGHPGMILPESDELAHRGGWQIMSVRHVLNWLGGAMLLLLFVFALCVLAGMVTGNIPMHLISCGFLAVLAPAAAALCVTYADKFLFGFNNGAELYSAITFLSPLLAFPLENGAPGWAAAAIYLALALAALALAAWFYARRALERAGDSFVFAFMGVLICYFSAYAGMTGMGMYFEGMFGSAKYLLGLAIGAALFFLVARMMVKKSPRVWEKRTFALLGVYAVLAALFVGSFRLDFLGYEKRLPQEGAVESASVIVPLYNTFRSERFDLTFDFWYQLPSRYYEGLSRRDGMYFRDPANIAAVRGLHGFIVSEREALRPEPSRLFPKARPAEWREKETMGYFWSGISGMMRLNYAMKGGGALTRDYEGIPKGFLLSSADFRRLVESEEFKETYSLKNPALGRPIRATVSSWFGVLAAQRVKESDLADDRAEVWGGATFDDFSAAQLASLIDAVQADLSAESYERITGDAHQLYNVVLEFEKPYDGDTEGFPSEIRPYPYDVSANGNPPTTVRLTVNLGIPSYFSRTEAWLRGNGLYEPLNAWLEGVEEVLITRWTSGGAGGDGGGAETQSFGSMAGLFGTATETRAFSDGIFVEPLKPVSVTDPEKILNVIRNAETQAKNPGEYWECALVLGSSQGSALEGDLPSWAKPFAVEQALVYFFLNAGNPALEALGLE